MPCAGSILVSSFTLRYPLLNDNECKKMKKNKRRTVLIVLLSIALIASAGVLALPKILKKEPAPLDVPLAAAERGALEERVSASGSFQAERYTTVASQTVGIVKKVYVRPGDRVETGDLIVVVDEREAKESLASAEIALEITRRNLEIELSSLRAEVRRGVLAFEQAQRAAESAESLKAVDGIPLEEYRKALEQRDSAALALSDLREKLRIAQGLPADAEPLLDSGRDAEFIEASPSYRNAKLASEGARRVLEGCLIRAEGSGIVTDIGIAVGDRLLVESVVARIEDLSSVMADVNVDEVDIGKIREGMSAEITADSLLGITLKGRVRRIWPIVKSDANGRVCKVRIDVSVGNNKVLTGASCMARITSRLRDDTLIIPAAALIPGAKPAAVWVAVEDTSAAGEQPAEGTGEGKSEKQGETPSPEVPARKLYKAERREIELGASTVSSVEVLSGLSQGDLVAVDLIPLITEGMKVRNGSR